MEARKATDSREQGGEKGPNKSQAARAAIDAGYEKPGAAVEYIKDEFGIDMNPQHFSAIKSNYKKALAAESPGRKAAGTAPKKRSGGFGGYVAPPTGPKKIDEPDMLLALESVRDLVDQFGAEKLKRMVDLLG